MYRIEVNIGQPDSPKWKIVRGTDSGPWGAISLSDAQRQMHLWFPNWSPATVRVVKDEE
jgi:hypothetical protein